MSIFESIRESIENKPRDDGESWVRDTYSSYEEEVRCKNEAYEYWRRLAKDTEDSNFLLSLSYSSSSSIYRVAGENPHMPKHRLEEYARSGHLWKMMAAAKNTSTPVHSIRELSLCKDDNITFRLLLNEATPKEILEKYYFSSPSMSVRELAQHVLLQRGFM